MTGAPRRPTSLVRRLVLLAVIWSLAVLLSAGVGLTLLFHRAAERRLDFELNPVLDNLYTSTSTDETGALTAPPLTDPQSLRAYSGRYWTIAQSDGRQLRWVVRSRSLWDAVLTLPPGAVEQLAHSEGRQLHFNAIGPNNQSVRVAATQLDLDSGHQNVVFMVAESRGPIDQDTRTFALITAVAVGVVGLGLVVAILLQVRIGLGPLFALRREITDVRNGKADRLAGVYPDELADLSSELNALLEHNQDVVERQRTHVGNLAHALKTPISVMLTEAGQRPGPLADVVSHQAEVMRAQVDHHLRRARAAARSQGSGERTEVASVLDELSRTLERIFLEKSLSIEWDAPDELNFIGERQDLLEIAGNLMENAGKWARRRVRVNAEAAGPNQFRLTVEDDGPGLPAERREEVLRRGARLDESAPGSGLGLSIVDELARAYGGGVSLGDSRLGGLRIDCLLPMAPP